MQSITNNLFLLIQTDERESEDCKDGGRDPLAVEIKDQGTTEKEKSRVEESAPEQDTMAGGEPQPPSTHAGHDRAGAEDHADKPSNDADLKEKKGEGERKEKENRDGAEEKTEKEQLKTEGEEKEEKGESEKATKGVEKQKQSDVDKAKDKPQLTGVEKQGKTKKKSGPPSSVSRPRTSARAIRSSAKKDIIAKFQQGAPE